MHATQFSQAEPALPGGAVPSPEETQHRDSPAICRLRLEHVIRETRGLIATPNIIWLARWR